MTISNEAVDKAAKVFYQDGWEGPPYWESLDADDPSRLSYLATARAALEAAEDLIRRESYEAGAKQAVAGVEPIYKAEIQKLTAEVAYQKARAAYFKYVPEIEHDPEGVQALVEEMRAAREEYFRLSGRGHE
jgi:hypothetical protein